MVMTFGDRAIANLMLTMRCFQEETGAIHDVLTMLTMGARTARVALVDDAPLGVLAILSTLGGLIGVPYALSSLLGGHRNISSERLNRWLHRAAVWR